MPVFTLIQNVLDELINYSPYNDEIQTIYTAYHSLRHRAHQIRGNFDFLSFQEKQRLGKAIYEVRSDFEKHGIHGFNFMKPLTDSEIVEVKDLLEIIPPAPAEIPPDSIQAKEGDKKRNRGRLTCL